MALNDFSAESPINFEQKCLCVLVLDVSGSMDGKPIKELNQGLQEFYREIKGDSTTANRLEISIVTFGSEIETLQEPALIENFSMPTLKINGTTKMVDGVRAAIAKVDTRKKWYKQTGQPYYRPWIILMTDGVPDNDQDVNGLSIEIEQYIKSKTFFFFGVGVENADMKILQQMSSASMPPAYLKGLKFGHFFKWLSASMATVAGSTDGTTIDLPAADDWMTGFTI